MHLPNAEWLSLPRKVIGIMTGTSLDGIDLALSEFRIEGKNHKLKIISTKTYEMPEFIRNKIIMIIQGNVMIKEVSEMNFLLADWYSSSVRQFLLYAGESIEIIDAIGIHGQTVWHEPSGKIPNTLQLVSGTAFSTLIEKTVVYDFRSSDVALMGQGAPLVPIFDYEFLSDETKNRTVLNIGGMSNVTYLPRKRELNKVIAFDTGPGNVWIDGAMKLLFNKNFDENGNIARQGKLIESFYDELKSIPFIHQNPPKSTGRELFTNDRLKHLIDKIESKEFIFEDIVYSLSRFTAYSIEKNISEFLPETEEVIASGGGTDNSFLMELLNKELEGIKIIRTDKLGIPSEAKEAICFAYLAWRTLGGLTGNLKTVTGCTKELVLGSIAPYYT